MVAEFSFRLFTYTVLRTVNQAPESGSSIASWSQGGSTEASSFVRDYEQFLLYVND